MPACAGGWGRARRRSGSFMLPPSIPANSIVRRCPESHGIILSKRQLQYVYFQEAIERLLFLQLVTIGEKVLPVFTHVSRRGGPADLFIFGGWMAQKRLLCIAPGHMDTGALLRETMPDWEIHSVTSLLDAGRELRNEHYLVGCSCTTVSIRNRPRSTPSCAVTAACNGLACSASATSNRQLPRGGHRASVRLPHGAGGPGAAVAYARACPRLGDAEAPAPAADRPYAQGVRR
jgi:hypothetical protein